MELEGLDITEELSKTFDEDEIIKTIAELISVSTNSNSKKEGYLKNIEHIGNKISSYYEPKTWK